MNELLFQIKALINLYIPEFTASLNPPASELEIQEAERAVGFKLPNELKELYRAHNGQSGSPGLFCGLSFLSIQDAIKEWKSWSEIAKDSNFQLDNTIISVPSNCIKEVYASGFYFPISTDYGGNNISIDFDPDAEGTNGQIINSGRDEETRYVIANNISDFIRFILEQLQSKNIRVESEKEYKNWYLKTPSNSHFFDTLDKLPLPYGSETNIETKSDEEFQIWLNNLDPKWTQFISQTFDSISGWHELQKIKSLNLLKCEFSAIDPLSEFTGLRELILSGNPVSDVSPLKSLPELKKLYLAKTRINSINDILELPNLAQLSLCNTEINRIDGITSLTNLKSFSIESTCIKDLTEIGKLKSLIELDLSKNQFTSLEPLRNLKKIKQLDLSDTNISNVNVIEGFKKLESLTMSGVNINDFSPLKSLPKLTSIICSYEDFLKIKDVVEHKVNFGISGGMTEKQEAYWRNYRLS